MAPTFDFSLQSNSKLVVSSNDKAGVFELFFFADAFDCSEEDKCNDTGDRKTSDQ